MSRLANPISDQSEDQSTSSDLLLPETKQTRGTVQTEPASTSGSSSGDNTKPRLLTVSYSCVVIVQSWFIYGLTIGYVSPVLSDLEGDGDGNSSAPLDKLVYQDLFIVLPAVSGLMSTIIAGWVVDKIGRKLSLLVCSITHVVGWLLVILTLLTEGTTFRILLFAGRFVAGIGMGFASLCAPLYIAELTPRKIRGFFGTMTQLSLSVGVFLGQLVGTYIAYYWLAVIILMVTFLFTVLAITLKETPRWLMTQKRNNEAREVLVWLRGEQFNVDKEMQEVAEQLELETKTKLNITETVQVFKKKSVYYPVVIAAILSVFQQCTGVVAVISNAEDIFKQAKIKSPGLTSSIALGGTQIVAQLFATVLVDILGRRVLLISSAVIASASLAVMGTYEYLNNEPYCNPTTGYGCKDHLYPLAIAAMACFIAGFSIGLGGIPWIITAEIVPLKVKGVGVGIVNCVNWILIIIFAGLFRNYENAVHPWGAFWSFGLVTFCGAIYIAVFVPETKGKSLEQIEHSFL